WQADDDGVLNPANIELKPGAIIPKAVGSQGLKPLEMPGRFDISQIVLEDLRARIRHALLADKLGPVVGPKMTATEVLERSAEMALLLGATYGRLQAELLTPLIQRAYRILRRRGEVPDVALDGRYVELDYRAPLARAQGQRNVQNTLSWISSVLAMGPEASTAVNLPEAARFLGDALGVPSDLIREGIAEG
ncbi:MAG: phage tail protein, partial [Alphaproteobacteria bacterium]|nr:phage tail protein [Alphaproteobacteria bacterium]